MNTPLCNYTCIITTQGRPNASKHLCHTGLVGLMVLLQFQPTNSLIIFQVF